MLTCREVRGAEEFLAARSLLREYAATTLGPEDCFQGIDREIAELPGAYAEPGGALLLAWLGVEPAGCVALRPEEDGTAELRRLYVRPQFRGLRLGRLLVAAAIDLAQRQGHAALRLHTLERMKEARPLYESMGFVRVEAPRQAGIPAEAMFFELSPPRLAPPAARPSLERAKLRPLGDRDLTGAYTVLRELREALTVEMFTTRLDRMSRLGYELHGVCAPDVLGVLGLRPLETMARGRHLHVDDLVVTESLRGRGLGTRLLDYAEKLARSRGLGFVYLDSRSEALHFYEKAGYEEHSAVLVRKRLL